MTHDGYGERLEREARFLMHTYNTPSPLFPRLLPAHEPQPNHLGRADFRGTTSYYTLYEYLDGELLSTWLLRNPQPYYKHALWLVLSVAKALNILHEAHLFHLALSPASILVYQDSAGRPRPVLIDLGMVATGEPAAQVQPAAVSSVYVAPEVALDHLGSARTDVYGLGLLLYQLLAGEPPRPPQWRPAGSGLIPARAAYKLERADLVQPLNELVRRAISYQEASRPPSVAAFASELHNILGEEVPPEKPPQRMNRRSVLLGVGLVLLIVALVIVALLRNEAGL